MKPEEIKEKSQAQDAQLLRRKVQRAMESKILGPKISDASDRPAIIKSLKEQFPGDPIAQIGYVKILAGEQKKQLLSGQQMGEQIQDDEWARNPGSTDLKQRKEARDLSFKDFNKLYALLVIGVNRLIKLIKKGLAGPGEPVEAAPEAAGPEKPTMKVGGNRVYINPTRVGRSTMVAAIKQFQILAAKVRKKGGGLGKQAKRTILAAKHGTQTLVISYVRSSLGITTLTGVLVNQDGSEAWKGLAKSRRF